MQNYVCTKVFEFRCKIVNVSVTALNMHSIHCHDQLAVYPTACYRLVVGLPIVATPVCL